MTCYVNASLEGLGAICGEKFYSMHLPEAIAISGRIVVFEMLNVLVALRLWGIEWSNKRVIIYCDNHAVVDILEGNRTRDRVLGIILREILMIQAKENI